MVAAAPYYHQNTELVGAYMKVGTYYYTLANLTGLE